MSVCLLLKATMYSCHTAECKSYTRANSSTKSRRNEGGGEENTRGNKGSGRRQAKNKKRHGLSPRANYTDRATAACRRSDCQLLRIEGATWSVF
jgi:hypothetical protein